MKSLVLTLRMIKIEHSVFALPFALISALVAADGLPGRATVLWILVAMVSARSCAMAFNRLVDREYDRKNPRTSHWPLAAGLLSPGFVWLFIGGCSALFIFSAYQLNDLAFALSPVALVIIFFYSLTKRFTILSHWFIGLALAIAPAGAWIAVRGDLSREPLFLCAAILFWTAGFDLIYSCQDEEFDRANALHSIPSRYGKSAALRISRLCHVMTASFLFVFGFYSGLGLWFFSGIAVVSGLLIYEHSLVSPGDFTRVDEAFFTVNGLISVLLLLATSIDIYF